MTVVDGRFDAQTTRTVQAPTRNKNQSKLFFAYGSWWGVLQEPTSLEARIQRLDWATQRWYDTGTVVDERPYARADVLFEADTLFVVSAGASPSPVQAVQVSEFTFDAATKLWSRKPDYPVSISPAGVTSSLIERASDGTLWVTYVENGTLLVTHSGRDAHQWVTPYRPSLVGTTAVDQVGMVAVGGEVVLLWSAVDTETIYATTHGDGSPDDAWASPTTVLKGLKLADDHVNLKALPDGRLFAAVKTSLDTVPLAQPGWDQIVVIDRQGGTWSSHQFSQIKDKHTRPIVLLDGADGQVLVFATSPTHGGAIYMKHAPFDQLHFETGVGQEVMGTPDDPSINNATTTKQTVDATTGVVVLASDDTTGRYVHVAASLGGPLPGTSLPAGPPPDGPLPATKHPTDLVLEPMDDFVPGSPIQAVWRTVASRDAGTVRYITRSAGDIAAQARTTSNGELRPCRSFASTETGVLTMTMDVRLDRQGLSDTTLILARGAAQELASLRVDRLLRLRVSRAGARETTAARIRPGVWYRVALRFDIAHRTFDARVSDAAGRTLVSRVKQPWRSRDATGVDALCVSPSVGTTGASLSFDDVRVTRIP